MLPLSYLIGVHNQPPGGEQHGMGTGGVPIVKRPAESFVDAGDIAFASGMPCRFATRMARRDMMIP